MDERRVNILRDSRAEISKLQLLSAFFEQESVYKIYLRSQVIHQLFEQNEELDIDKLELFHVQFSSSVIELLRKIKKNNEKNVTLLYDEMQLNKELMEQMSSTVYTTKNYQLDQQKQSLKINQSLRKLFQVLSDHSEEFPFSKNINSFSSRFSKDFYYNINPEQLGLLTDYDAKDMYVDVHASIHKKLMGMLCKYDFRTEFSYGLKSGQLIIEVYKFLDTDRQFIFFPSRNLFLFLNAENIKDVDLSNQGSEKERMIQELAYKNDRLESSAAVMKTYIPNEITDLLEDNYIKISDINFLDHLNNFDVQANILKAMLKTDLF